MHLHRSFTATLAKHINRSEIGFEMLFGHVNIRISSHVFFKNTIISYTDTKTNKYYEYIWGDIYTGLKYLPYELFQRKEYLTVLNKDQIYSVYDETDNCMKKRLAQIVKMTYRILYAEKTGGHFHPNQRI